MPVLRGRCVLPSVWAVCLYQPRLESPASHLPDCSPAMVLAANCSQLFVVLHTLQGERSLVKTLSEHLLSVCAGCTSSRWSCPPELKCQSQSPPHTSPGVDQSPLWVLHANSEPPGFRGGLLPYCSSYNSEAPNSRTRLCAAKDTCQWIRSPPLSSRRWDLFFSWWCFIPSVFFEKHLCFRVLHCN